MEMEFTNTSNITNCDPHTTLTYVMSLYSSIHTYLCLIICPLGAFTNALNVVILNQKRMRSPTNFLLTALAISDGLIMAFYIPFDAYFLLGKHLFSSPYPWTVYMLLYISAQHVLHALSSGLIVTLAAFRVLYVRFITRCKVLCSMERARLAVAIVTMISIVLTIPYSMAHHITAINNNTDLYMVNYVDNANVRKWLFWNTAVFIKLLPLILVTILSLILIMTIRQRAQLMKKLKARANPSKQDYESSQDKTGTRTTKLLLSIILIFMISYLPQAILLLLSGILGFCFSENVYDQIGDLMDLLTLLNNGINFVLYCSMSRQFRETFVQMFCPRVCRWQSTEAGGQQYCEEGTKSVPRTRAQQDSDDDVVNGGGGRPEESIRLMNL